jgi:MFS family permease
VFSQFAGTALWFAPNAALQDRAGPRELALLTSCVNIGFICGTLLSSALMIVDRTSPRHLFALMCALGAALNAACLVFPDSILAWAVLRTLVGVCLAGIYPVGMRIAAAEFPRGLGVRLGLVVGALTLGTALPWLLRALGASQEPQSEEQPLLLPGSETEAAAGAGAAAAAASGDEYHLSAADDSASGLPLATTLATVSALALAGGLLIPAVLGAREPRAAVDARSRVARVDSAAAKGNGRGAAAGARVDEAAMPATAWGMPATGAVTTSGSNDSSTTGSNKPTSAGGDGAVLSSSPAPASAPSHPARRAQGTAGLSLDRSALRLIFAPAGFRTALYGYCGHSWELYGFWAYVPTLIEAHARAHSTAAVLLQRQRHAAEAAAAVAMAHAGGGGELGGAGGLANSSDGADGLGLSSDGLLLGQRQNISSTHSSSSSSASLLSVSAAAALEARVCSLTFCAIGIGALSCALGGLLSARVGSRDGSRGGVPGSAIVAQLALALSMACCLVAPFYAAMGEWVFTAYVLVWGAAVIADSAQFSALVAASAHKPLMGTALALSTCVGFSLTVVSLQCVAAVLRTGADVGVAMCVTLAPGPALGLVAMYRQWPLHHAWRGTPAVAALGIDNSAPAGQHGSIGRQHGSAGSGTRALPPASSGIGLADLAALDGRGSARAITAAPPVPGVALERSLSRDGRVHAAEDEAGVAESASLARRGEADAEAAAARRRGGIERAALLP